MPAESSRALTAQDRALLSRCVEIAAEALAAGDEPFGTILADADGTILFEDRNRVNSRQDATAHPEFSVARWAAQHLSAEQRVTASVYTSGEHCPMCAAAHAWVGLGPITYVASAEQLAGWSRQWGSPAPPVASLSIGQVAPSVEVFGPVDDLAEHVRALHAQYRGVTGRA